jgi:polysaccharide chain length determinant protein (PEP-CTERM system associated)
VVNLFQLDRLQAGLTPRSILRALGKRKLSILALWLAGSAATVAVVYSLRPVYSAEALILVESQKIPENFVAATVQTALEARLDELKQQVLSRERLWNLTQEFDLYPRQRQIRTREEVVEMMRRDVTIVLERGWSTSRPGAFRVAYESTSPQITAEVANRIGRFFIDENLRARAVEAEATSAFLDNQLAQSKKELQEQEAKLRDFKEAYLGELPQQEGSLLAAMSQKRAELLGVQDSLGRAQQSRLVLESSLAVAQANQDAVRRRAQEDSGSPIVFSLPAPEQPQQAPPSELDKARAQLQALRARYEDKHPEVQRMLLEVARLQNEEQAREAQSAEIPTEPPAVASRQPGAMTVLTERPRRAAAMLDDSAVRSLKAQIALESREIQNLEARHAQVIQEATELQRQMQKMPIREQQLAAITRDYDTCKANYQSLLNKKLAADVATNMERWQKAERFVMLDAARIPEKPVRPKRALLTAGGSILSLLAAAAFALLLELRRNVVLGEWELPAGTVVLGRLPRMEMERI